MRQLQISLLIIFLPISSFAQEISNGNFNSFGTDWGCSPEVLGEDAYGGTDPANLVAEVDSESGLCQAVSGLVIGEAYVFSFECSRRIGGETPATVSMDVSINGGALDLSISKSNTTFNLELVSYCFVATLTTHTIDFSATTDGTFGLIIDNVFIGNPETESIFNTPTPVICTNNFVSFENNSENASTYFWDFGDGNTSTEFEPSNYYIDPGTYTVMLITTDSEGCYSPDTSYLEITVIVFEGEVGTLNDTICPGTEAQLFVTGGDIYSWSPAEFLDDSFSSNPKATIYEETTFTVTIESFCGITELDVIVYVYNSDAGAAQDTAICSGESVFLTASGGDSYLWSPSMFLDDPTSSTPLAFPTITTNFVVKITTDKGCLIRDTVNVLVDQNLPYPNLIDQVSICKGDSIRITAGGASDYLWSPNYNISDFELYNPFVYPDIDTSYIVTFSNACGSVIDSVKVHVIRIDANVSLDVIICPGDSVQLWVTGGDFYEWYPSGYLSSTIDDNPISSPGHDITYTVFVSNDFGCTEEMMTNISLYDLPEIETSITSDAPLVVGDDIHIKVETDGDVTWSPPYFIDCTTCNETVVYPPGETYYIATVTDHNDCQNSKRLEIQFDPIIYIPNAFTPDGDAYNNKFKVQAQNLIKFQLQIFNRWGEVVYISQNIDEPWDGSQNGRLAEDGSYVWQIHYTDLTGISHEINGIVTLLK